MKVNQRHGWALTIEEAIAIQEQLRKEIVTIDSFESPVNANFSQTIKNQFTSLDVRHFLIHHQLKFMMVNKVSIK